MQKPYAFDNQGEGNSQRLFPSTDYQNGMVLALKMMHQLCNTPPKRGAFSKQMEFRKRSNNTPAKRLLDYLASF